MNWHLVVLWHSVFSTLRKWNVMKKWWLLNWDVLQEFRVSFTDSEYPKGNRISLYDKIRLFFLDRWSLMKSTHLYSRMIESVLSLGLLLGRSSGFSLLRNVRTDSWPQQPVCSVVTGLCTWIKSRERVANSCFYAVLRLNCWEFVGTKVYEYV